MVYLSHIHRPFPPTPEVQYNSFSTRRGAFSSYFPLKLPEIVFGYSTVGTDELDKLQQELREVKGKFEVKLEKDNSSGGRYKARPDSTNHEITVEEVPESGTGFKGYRHYINSPSTIGRVNRITIHGHVTDGINQNVLASQQFNDGGGVYVYFSKDGDDDLQRPYLICLSQSGTSNGNTWYKRKRNTSGSGYTWNDANGTFGESDDPNTINVTFANKLQGIKQDLGGTGDPGYPNPPDRNDDLPNPESAATDVTIWIDRTKPGYDHSSGTVIENADKIESGNIKVFLKNNEPKNGFKRYMHKVRGTQDGQYRKMTVKTKFKNGATQLSITGIAGDVNYVHVYYGTSPNKPLLIAICKDNSDSCSWEYYKNNNPAQANSEDWSPEGITEAPGNSNHDFLMHLDMLNDQANSETVIHIEKTYTKGTIIDSVSTKIYKTGSQGTGNKWYSRGTNNTWTDANTEGGYSGIDPGTIGTTLVPMLHGIKDKLGDKGTYCPR